MFFGKYALYSELDAVLPGLHFISAYVSLFIFLIAC